MLIVNCSSQENKKYFTVYSNGYLEAINKPITPRKGYQAYYPFASFAYQKENKRIFYQIDLMPFLMDIREHSEYGSDVDGLYIRLWIKQKRFESSFGFILKYWLLLGEKVRINVALENRIYYIRNILDIYGYYAQSENNYGLSTALGFEIEKPINETFSITFMPLYRINEFYLKRNSSDNPSIPEDLRTVYAFKNNFNPLKYNLKIGVKIKI
jgi:hypothetical protein